MYIFWTACLVAQIDRGSKASCFQEFFYCCFLVCVYVCMHVYVCVVHGLNPES